MLGVSSSMWAPGHQGRVLPRTAKAAPAPLKFKYPIQVKLTQDGTSAGETSNQAEKQPLDPVQKYLASLDLGRDVIELRTIATPRSQRVYSVEWLLASRTDGTYPRPFIFIPPGKFFDVHKNLKLAIKAKERSRTLEQAIAAEKGGKIKLPETPDAVRESRRVPTPPETEDEFSIEEGEVLSLDEQEDFTDLDEEGDVTDLDGEGDVPDLIDDSDEEELASTTLLLACNDLDDVLESLRILIDSKERDQSLVGVLQMMESIISNSQEKIRRTVEFIEGGPGDEICPRRSSRDILSTIQELQMKRTATPGENHDPNGVADVEMDSLQAPESNPLTPIAQEAGGSISYVLEERAINPNVPVDKTDSENKVFECGICKTGRKYRVKAKYLHHLEMKHFYCGKCELAYTTREELVNHLEMDERSHNFCKLCLLDFQTPDAYTKHHSKEHTSRAGRLVCLGCNLKCNEAFEIIRHLENGFCLEISKSDFQQARVVTALIQRHSLGALQSLSTAEQTTVKEYSFKLLRGDECIVAGLPLVKQSAWSPFFDSKLHEVLAYAGKIWRCPYQGCPSSFNQLQDFINHLRSGHFTYGSCPSCFKPFESIYGLFQHITKSQKGCKILRSSNFPHAVTAVSGGYIKADGKDGHGHWILTAGTAPDVDLYMNLPQVSGRQ